MGRCTAVGWPCYRGHLSKYICSRLCSKMCSKKNVFKNFCVLGLVAIKNGIIALAWWISLLIIDGDSHRQDLRRCADRRCQSYVQEDYQYDAGSRRDDGLGCPRRWRWMPSPTHGEGGCDWDGLGVGRWLLAASGRRWRMRFPGWRGGEYDGSPLLPHGSGKLSSTKSTADCG